MVQYRLPNGVMNIMQLGKGGCDQLTVILCLVLCNYSNCLECKPL
jgi:hypothetical protein